MGSFGAVAYGECHLNYSVLWWLRESHGELPRFHVIHCKGLGTCISRARKRVEALKSGRGDPGGSQLILLLIDRERDSAASKYVDTLLSQGFRPVCGGRCRGMECYVHASYAVFLVVCLFLGGPEEFIRAYLGEVADKLSRLREGFGRLKRRRVADKVVRGCSDRDVECQAVLRLSEATGECIGCALRELGVA